MSQAFDPYHKWLGIAPKDQPPNHYRLLGIDLFESDREVIQSAAEQRIAHVRTFQLSEFAEVTQQMLNELAAARVCLLNAEKKAAYDAKLKARQRPTATAYSRVAAPVAPLLPPVELDLVTPAAIPLPPLPANHASRQRPMSLLNASQRKRSRRAWLLPVGVALTAAISLAAFALWPLHDEKPSPTAPDTLPVHSGTVHTDTLAASPTPAPTTDQQGLTDIASTVVPDSAAEAEQADGVLGEPRRSTDRRKDWAYGYVAFDAGENRVVKFTRLPYFNGWWHGSVEYPDPLLDYASLTAAGGHPGLHHAVVRRWISPAEGVVSIKGTLTHISHEADSDGVRGRVVSGRSGIRGEWSVRAGGAETNIAMFDVAPAESVDFVVDCLMQNGWDSFDWPVTLELRTKNGEIIGTWDSVADFAGPESPAPAGQFADFRGYWVVYFPSPEEPTLEIDSEGNANFSCWPNITWRGHLRKDGDATLLVRSDEPLARLRIEHGMLIVEQLQVTPDWPRAVGIGVGVRHEGTGTPQHDVANISQLRDADRAWDDFDLHGNSVSEGFARLTGTALSTKHSHAGPLDITVVARTRS